jgi:uncharacterized protein (DUF433 family)
VESTSSPSNPVNLAARQRSATGSDPQQAAIRNMRITVADVLSYLASGMSEDEILTDFPELTRDDIRACLAYAAERESHTVVTRG